MKRILYTLAAFAFSFGLKAQFVQNVTTQSAVYYQDFNTLDVTTTNSTNLPAGWAIAETGTGANNMYISGDGSSNGGNTYSFGTGTNTDRALGGVASGSLATNFYVRLRNTSGTPITQFTVYYRMEQWRSGGARTTPDTLYFTYATNAAGFQTNHITTSPWTRVTALDGLSRQLLTTGAALDGNSGANSKGYQATVTGLNIASGDTLYIRFTDHNAVGNDDGLAVDEFYFSASSSLPVEFLSFNAKAVNSDVLLNWSTASETNNAAFDIERSADGMNFEAIARVVGAGNSTTVLNYSFTDITPLKGINYYRIKQTDYDGAYTYSSIMSVVSNRGIIVSSAPNPFSNELVVSVEAANASEVSIEVFDMMGKVHYTAMKQVAAGSNQFSISTHNLPDGIYFVRTNEGGEINVQKIIKK